MVTEVFECVRQTVPAEQKVIKTPYVTILANDEQFIRCAWGKRTISRFMCLWYSVEWLVEATPKV